MNGVGGALGCDGALRLQSLQFSRCAVISGVMPGQNMEDSARAVMLDTPWCAAWRSDKVSERSDGGMTIQSLNMITPSTL